MSDIDLIPAATDRPLPIVIVGHVDHGKSTLIGRLLHDTDSLPDGKLEQLSAISQKRGLSFEWSFLLDALQVERDQGITVDTTQIWFSTAQRRYVIIDAPGHKEFLKSMVSGASRADAAVLVVDAGAGMSEQTRRHAYLLHLLGLTRVIVAVNKMDAVGHDARRFAVVAAESRDYLARIGIAPQAIIPLSARHGDNVAAASAAMGWYEGPTLVAALDALLPQPAAVDRPLRLPVQDVYRFDDRRVAVGRISSGRLQVGDAVKLNPSGRIARVARLEDWNRDTPRLSAIAGQSVSVVLDEEVFAERGQVLSLPDLAPVVAETLAVRLFWLDAQPLRAGARLRLRVATGEAEAIVASIDRLIDIEALQAGPGAAVERNAVAEARLRLLAPLAVDTHAEHPETGRGVLVADGRVVGGFVVDRAEREAARRLTPVTPSVSPRQRAAANGHRGGVVWLTGLSGAGKSTLANAALRALFARGWQVQLLDGDNLRIGLSADLGFSREDRAEHLRRTAEVARLMADGGALVLVALISPYARDRAQARGIVGSGFREVYVHADLETCRARDVKGLYAAAAAGAVTRLTGVAQPYEVPQSPDLVLDTIATTVEAAAEALVQFVRREFTETEIDIVDKGAA